MEGHRPGRHVLAGPAEHERVEELVRDQVAGGRVVLGAPRGRDRIAQVALEPGARQGDVRQHRHHVDHERLALRAVERLATGLVDEREQVPGQFDRVRVTTGRHRRLAQPLEDAAERGDGFGRASEIPVGLLPGQLDERLAVGGDDDRDPVGRGEHRLDRREARRRRGEALAGPQRADVIDRLRDALDGRVRFVRDAHLLEPQRKPRPEPKHEPPGEDLVERRAGHSQHDGMSRERVGGPERHPEPGLVAAVVEGDGLGDRGREGDAVALEVRVVDPDRIEPLVAGLPRPEHHVLDVASRREAETDGTIERAHDGAPGVTVGR